MKLFQRTSVAAAVLAFFVITLGAWVRLTDAGLGCPDWPGCFGHLTVPQTEAEIARAQEAFDAAHIDQGKAWREMIHRYVASTLGLLIMLLALLAWRNRRDARQPLLLPLLLVPLVVFQGLLGMWTVTLLLQPLVVLAHLLGGLTVLAILVWLALTTRERAAARHAPGSLRALAAVALIATFAQIALGGWTSTHYAALACPDFPTCQNQWWPEADFAEGFVPWRGIESSFEGGVLMHPARVAIHLTHRVGALILTALLVLCVWRAGRHLGAQVRRAQWAVGLTLALQIAIGVAIVTYGLPLWLGVAHNGNAALLMLAVLYLGYAVRHRDARA